MLIGGEWRFVTPAEGLLLFDRSSRSLAVFRSQWYPASVVVAPSGGSAVDAEARTAITALIGALQTIGVLGVPGT